MPAVVALIAGAITGVVAGVSVGRRVRWRPTGRTCAWIVVLAAVSVAYEIWFVFVFGGRDDGLRSHPAPLAFIFLWTLGSVGCGTAARATYRAAP